MNLYKYIDQKAQEAYLQQGWQAAHSIKEISWLVKKNIPDQELFRGDHLWSSSVEAACT